MTYKTKSCYKYVSGIDFQKIKRIVFGWYPYYDQGGGYWYLIEKKFIAFITYNNQLVNTDFFNFHPINISSNFEKNFLTKDLLDYFINDIYNSFKMWPELKEIFKPNEYKEFYIILSNYYYNFYPKMIMKININIYQISLELLPYVLNIMIYIVCSNFIQII